MRPGHPELTVGAFIVSPVGEVLLVVSPKWNYLYSIPGGHVEKGESVFEAVVRESSEEVGIKVKPLYVLAMQEVAYPEQFRDNCRHFIFIDVLCRALSTNVRLDGSEVVGYIWASPLKALKLPLEKYTRRLLRLYLSRPKSKQPMFFPEVSSQRRRRLKSRRRTL